MAVILWFALPRYKQHSDLNYLQLLGSIFSVYRHSPVLRNRAMLGYLSFACFSNLWTSMSFLLAAPVFHFSELKIGLFGLVGTAGVLAATRAGALAYRGKAKMTTLSGLLLRFSSWVLVWYGQYYWPLLVLGIIALETWRCRDCTLPPKRALPPHARSAQSPDFRLHDQLYSPAVSSGRWSSPRPTKAPAGTASASPAACSD